ncbi:unnamed protein product [Closterium sp. NIES-64]|nr:unnamed protein product [Closterium sp. NIES-64]
MARHLSCRPHRRSESRRNPIALTPSLTSSLTYLPVPPARTSLPYLPPVPPSRTSRPYVPALAEQRRHGAGGTRGPVWRRGLREGRTVQVPIYDLKSSTRVGFRVARTVQVLTCDFKCGTRVGFRAYTLSAAKMVEEAEKYAAEDKEKREAVDVKNQADSMIYQTEKQLKELAEKVPAEVITSWRLRPVADGRCKGA